MKSVVITGASSGIGLGTAQVLVANGFRVFGSVRKEFDEKKLKSELGQNFEPFVMDLLDEQSIQTAAQEIGRKLGHERLFGLINNAGIVSAAPLALQRKDDFLAQINVNLVGPFLVTQAFLPLLGVDPNRTGESGRVINISSVGGKMGGPFLGAYAAAKHGLEGMSESLRRELAIYGITVVIVGPGSVATPIWDKAKDRSTSDFKGTAYEESFTQFHKFITEDSRNGLSPSDIGKVVYRALTEPNPKVRYAVVRKKLLNWTLPNLLPRKWVDVFMTKNFSLIHR
jgi:NAD(P)-dependent dehydrogenase (short-subunit alcohol dehydrogenase family)